jgi:hypothetical protein
MDLQALKKKNTELEKKNAELEKSKLQAARSRPALLQDASMGASQKGNFWSNVTSNIFGADGEQSAAGATQQTQQPQVVPAPGDIAQPQQQTQQQPQRAQQPQRVQQPRQAVQAVPVSQPRKSSFFSKIFSGGANTAPDAAAVQQQQPRAAVPVPAQKQKEEPLPPGWEVRLSRTSAKKYYANPTLKTTQWERPRIGDPPATRPVTKRKPTAQK